jgi:hypothetical protein
MLKNLLENAPRMTCAISKAELMWIPEYELTLETQEVESEEHKRKLESEKTIQGVKKPKKDAKSPLIQGARESNAPPLDQDLEVPLNEAQAKRLEKLGPNLEELKMDCETTLQQLQGQDIRDFIPPGIQNKFKGETEALEKVAAQAVKLAYNKKGGAPNPMWWLLASIHKTILYN